MFSEMYLPSVFKKIKLIVMLSSYLCLTAAGNTSQYKLIVQGKGTK